MTGACEVSWFSALCDDDYEFLGVPDPALRSSWEHCRDIVMQAESGGFDNILLPSGYQLGIDTTAFAAGIAPLLKRMRLLMAVRIGESWPPQLARQIATIDRMLGGRLTVNIISSDRAGETLALRWTDGVMNNSGSSANLLAVAALANPATKDGLRPGDEVIVPALSWSTTVWPVIQCGLKPVICDIDPATFNIDPNEIEKAIGYALPA